MPRLLTGTGLATITALSLSAALAGCAAWVDRRADTREAMWESRYPPLGELVDVQGRRVHVHATGQPAGTAPDVVLIHGANGNLRDFTHDLVGRLADDFRVVAVDRPGLGWSDSWGELDSDPQAQARILRAALEPLGLRRPIVVGHSYGGAVAMGWALEAEAQTGALVILAGATQPWPGELGLFYRLQNGALGDVSRQFIAGLVREETARTVTRRIFAPDPMPAGYLDHFGPGLSMRRDTRANNARQVNALKAHLARMAPLYPHLTLPIELLHGTRDTIVGLDIHSRRLAATVGTAELTEIEGVGHMPHHARPEMTMAAIRRAATRAGLN